MTLESRLKKLELNLKKPVKKIHLLGWANCTWTKSEGLEKLVTESKQEFIDRVIRLSKKQFIWFD
jgi:hypothetical protein